MCGFYWLAVGASDLFFKTIILVLTGLAGVCGLLLFYYSLRLIGRLLGSAYPATLPPLGRIEFILLSSVLGFAGWILFITGGFWNPSELSGLPLYYTALCGIIIPLSGIMFFKRQWIIGHEYQHRSAACLYGRYYSDRAVGILSVILGLCFSLPVGAMILHCAGELISSILQGGGGATDILQLLAEASFPAPLIDGVLGTSHFSGGHWSAAMILTFMLGLLGVQCGACFTTLVLVAKHRCGFAMQQVWISAILIGGLIVCFSALIFSKSDFIWNFSGAVIFTHAFPLIGLLLLVGAGLLVLVVSTLMVLSGLSLYLREVDFGDAEFTGGVAGFEQTDAQTKQRSRSLFLALSIALLLMVLAWALSTFAQSWDMLTFGLICALSLQLWPGLMGICYVAWFTGRGILLGMIGGIAGVLLTDLPNVWIAELSSISLPFGRYPLSLHSAFWGIVINLLIVVFVSCFTQRRNETEQREKVHQLYLSDMTSMGGNDVPYRAISQNFSSESRLLTSLGFVFALLWFFFGVGPGILIGNDLLGSAYPTIFWGFEIPSLILWQIISWAAGVCLLWFLACRINSGTR